MNIREISDVFKDTTGDIEALKSYNFGWASDRVRQGNTEDFQELNQFPRVFFSVPTITASDQTRKQDTYQVTLFFDDLLGYDNEGDADLTLQLDKWAALQEYANYFVQRLNKIKQTILPNYLFIPEAPSITFDSFTGLQRMITVQLSFNLVVPTNCDPGVITLVQCIANIVTSSNLTASLTTVLKFAASLEGTATVTADISFVQKVASSLNANAFLSGDINFVQKAQASLLTSANVTGNITIPQLLNASLLATGTTTANLTVTSSSSLLLDLYPNAGAAYSLRKLRTAYTGSAVTVRASTSGAEGDVSFDVNNTISESSTVIVTVVGTSGLSIGQQVTFSTFWNAGGSNQNVFVTTWYDQSGNARNATQGTQANQPQIVSSGSLLTVNTKPTLLFDGTNDVLINNSMNYSKENISILMVNKRINSSNHSIGYGPLTPTPNAGFIMANLNIRSGLDGRPTGAAYFSVNSSLPGTINQILQFNICTTTNMFASSNGTNFTNLAISTPEIKYDPTNHINIAAILSVNLYYNCNVQEIVIYPTNETSNKLGLETNINTHYAIY
jgi:hypothetical protein